MAHNSHGHTPAAWTTVIIIFVGFVIGAIGVMSLNWPLFWIGGVGVVVVGGIVGKSMQMMGLGQTEPPAGKAESHAGQAEQSAPSSTNRPAPAAAGGDDNG